MKERSRQYPKFLGPVAQQGLQLRRRGIVPQKNVLFPTLSVCKSSKFGKLSSFPRNEDLERLLIDCDWEEKIRANADMLSGGQKRKLQLAIGLLGGSKGIWFNI